MVQVGSKASYDGLMEERRPDEDEGVDQGLVGAIRGLVESVNATSRQFADAADSFARETMRVMEAFSSRLEHSASESRDMAGMAGRSADEARRLSEQATDLLSTAEQRVRAEVDIIVAEVRAQMDEALRSAGEAVSSARQAAEDAQQRSRETFERVEQVAASSQQAATAAETAADAAKRSADSVEQAAAEARERLLEDASRMDQEAAARMEQSVVASQEAAGAAERAAEDARSAALEAMTHAAEARTPALESAIGIGAQELLDRLEADYQLLTEVVQSLHSRIAGLNGAAYVLPAPEGVMEEEAPYSAPALPEPETPSDPISGPAVADLDSRGWSWPETAEGTSKRSWAGAVPTSQEEVTPPSWPISRQRAAESEPPQPEASPWPGELSPETRAFGAASGPWPSAADTEPGSDWPPSRLETAPEWHIAAAVNDSVPTESENPAATGVPFETAPPSAEEDPAPSAPDPTTDSGPPGLVFADRVVLNVAPVPDFDRLLSLDGALGRLDFVRNVTLADYAKEEVTFRVELAQATNVEDFTGELGAMSGQSFEVMAVSPGQLELRIIGSAS